MQHTAADGPRLGPQAAYSRWIDACTDAGWLGVPAAEQVPVRERLGRVTAASDRACWPAPRATCAAMDGIAIKAGSVACPADAASRWRLAASSFSWVDTGDPVPACLDTVAERERVQLSADGSALITGPPTRIAHTRRGRGHPGRPAAHPGRPSPAPGRPGRCRRGGACHAGDRPAADRRDQPDR